MKLVTFMADKPRIGVLSTDASAVIDLHLAWLWHERKPRRDISLAFIAEKYGTTMLDFIERSPLTKPAAEMVLAAHQAGDLPAEIDGSRIVHDISKVTLKAPIPRPTSMRDGYAFRQHVMTARRNRGLEMIPEFDEFPVFYFTNHQSVIGPGPLVAKKLHLDKLDFELEAAIVMGQTCRDVSPQEADANVFGMMVMNDFSARTLQMEEMKLSLGPAKGKDFATGLGPYLVTLDELADRTTKTEHGNVYNLEMRAFVNGKRVSLGNVNEMNWTFADIISRASYGVTLSPGDVIGSGTCGTGCFLELNGSKITDNQWLKPGDVVALEIERLGRLENTIVAE